MMGFLTARTSRERWLMLLAFLICVPLLIYTLLYIPLRDQRAAAEQAVTEALALNSWTADRAVEMATVQPLAPGQEAPKAGAPLVEQSLVDAGLWGDLDDLAVEEDALRLRFDAVSFTRIADWMGTEVTRLGYDLGTFRLERLEGRPSQVAAVLTLE